MTHPQKCVLASFSFCLKYRAAQMQPIPQASVLRDAPPGAPLWLCCPQGAASAASWSKPSVSRGPCSVNSVLSRHTFTVPLASPAASSWVCWQLNSRQ